MTDAPEDMLGQAPSADDVELALSTATIEAALFGAETTVKMGRFVLLGELGRGGMGVVYSAWDPQLDRRVALKVVRPELSGGRRDARILREAKAAARLSDPNIVAVHEVGESKGRLFIAMAYVDGESLEAFSAAKVGVRTCVELYLQAARGLATAHAAGIVHRDFKPGNVLVSRTRSGLRAQVTDFGVARMVSSTEEPSHDHGAELGELTVDGAIVGTPAYMAPEQFEGAKVGPAADQFSLCVSLFEALHGVRPFEATTVEGLREATRAGRITTKGRTDAPGGVVAAVRRGLSPNPDDRYPDVSALIDALEAGLHRRRRRLTVAAIVGAVGLAALGGAMGGSGATEPSPPRCERLADAWTQTAEQGRAVIERMQDGSTLQRSTRANIEDYGQRWADARTSVCRATHVQGTQSPALLDLRVACLDQVQLEAETLFTALAEGVDAPGGRALDALVRLDPPERCVHATESDSVVPPTDPQRREDFDALQRGLAEARTDFRLARWKPGYARASELLERAQAYADDRLLAQTMSMLATFESRVGDPAQATSLAKEALGLAVAADDDRTASTIATGLVYLTGYLLGDTEAAETFGQLALAWSDGDPAQRAAALENLGINAYAARNYDLAESRHREARTLLEPGPTSIRSAINLTAALTTQPDVEKQREAGILLRETLRTAEDTYGENNPLVAALLQNLAGRAPAWIPCEEARPLLDRAIEIKTRTVGEGAMQLVTTLNKRGSCRRRMGDPEAALVDVDRSIAIILDKVGPDSPKLLGPYERRIEALLDLGRLEEAEAQLETLTELSTKLYGIDDPEGYGIFTHRAALLRARGRDADALAPQRRAVEMARKVSPDSPWTREQELRLAELSLALGRRDEARALATAVRDDTHHPGPFATEQRSRAAALLAAD